MKVVDRIVEEIERDAWIRGMTASDAEQRRAAWREIILKELLAAAVEGAASGAPSQSAIVGGRALPLHG
ncbi:MAG TPA: hypothetical protein VFT22_31140 [Kofleriaceae bacterium]|nr:hypothetical protein [Kofleriaceae bacterium]